jgi:sucrose phosphorylase
MLDMVAPNVMLITETNVPHQENIAYFGDGRNEAQLVYNFSLAPLILHTIHSGNVEALQAWVAGLEKLPNTATFFNFIASHDGIGLRPVEGILNRDQIQALVDQTLAHGGQVSYKTNPDGSQSAYELNITLFDALSDPQNDEPEALKINRFLVSQAIMLALTGMPGIYVHSLVGSSNDDAGFARTGRPRSLNRRKWPRAELEAALANPASRSAKVFRRYAGLLKARASQRAFHPTGDQQIIAGHPALFSLWRIAPDGRDRVLCLHNVSAQPQAFQIHLSELPVKAEAHDLLSGEKVVVQDRTLQLTVAPYEVKWLALSHD